jgi:acyl-CoA reductase-like NAD-dependent aldehyde dehydrogenase
MEDIQLLIAGRAVPAARSATFNRQNPISGEVATRAAAASVEDARAAADAAAAAFPKWAALGPSERRAKLNHAAQVLESRAAQFATIVTAETGATAGWGHFNVHLAANMLREAAAMTTQISGEIVPSGASTSPARRVWGGSSRAWARST